MSTRKVPAVLMRGGTTKGVIFKAADLPRDPAARDRLLLRLMGSPDPYGKQMDGMGGGSSSTSKVVLLSPSRRDDCDVDYLFGQVAIDRPLVDWSGSCGNLVPAVAAYAVSEGLLSAPRDGSAAVGIWQVNLQRRLVAHVPVAGGEVVEAGDLPLDGVAFPGAEIRIEYPDPAGADGPLLPTGRPVDELDVPSLGRLPATLIDAGMPTVLIEARAIGLDGTELPPRIDDDATLLSLCEEIRAAGAVAMGLADAASDASSARLHTPKLCLVAPPAGYRASGGRLVAATETDILARILSMGRLHHAMTGTGAVSLAAAAAIPGTLAAGLAPRRPGNLTLRIGHPSGVMSTSVELGRSAGGGMTVTRAVMSRTARRLMEGMVCVPE